ncbi:MAG: putative O-glycosylation ligase, exosortase A system-associated [Acetobacteraceae bacterium]|nr:putative O-glycosylation ligase, exosortase A system-associated [Acetobacteraceae bacterium]MBV8526602.1 putative O-glycosylation ligase, exosortase A system-associated [Acetobacteraceae bacterium]MBV8588454.1 putative O-glycosylation ligase, exosortase A system-associated [Acetobacteraceae bacterium]
MRSLYLSFIYLMFLLLGTMAPFVFSLGYLWVDAATPQYLVYFLLNQIPCSLIMAVGAIGGYLLLDRRAPPKNLGFTSLTIVFAIWCSLSTAFWAVVPDAAWNKWDWAFKSMMFSAFIPFIFRSRLQIEAFLQVWMFSLGAQIIPYGAKVVISGGGYGLDLGLVSGNSGLAEGGMLSAVAAMLIPIIMYLRAHGQLLPKHRVTDLFYLAMIAACIATAVGTYERSALIGLLVVGASVWLQAKRKILYGVLGCAIAATVMYGTSQGWNERISTINDYNKESSALGRILVWEWTLDFVGEHPEGGGFDAYRINRIVFPDASPDDPSGGVVLGKAFHSIYFEILGEQGWFGLGLFGTIALVSFRSLRKARRRAKSVAHLAWCDELARALTSSLLAMLSCGAFIGIGYQPMLWYLFAMSACLHAHVGQVDNQLATRPKIFPPVTVKGNLAQGVT